MVTNKTVVRAQLRFKKMEGSIKEIKEGKKEKKGRKFEKNHLLFSHDSQGLLLVS